MNLRLGAERVIQELGRGKKQVISIRLGAIMLDRIGLDGETSLKMDFVTSREKAGGEFV